MLANARDDPPELPIQPLRHFHNVHVAAAFSVCRGYVGAGFVVRCGMPAVEELRIGVGFPVLALSLL